MGAGWPGSPKLAKSSALLSVERLPSCRLRRFPAFTWLRARRFVVIAVLEAMCISEIDEMLTRTRSLATGLPCVKQRLAFSAQFMQMDPLWGGAFWGFEADEKVTAGILPKVEPSLQAWKLGRCAINLGVAPGLRVLRGGHQILLARRAVDPPVGRNQSAQR